MADFFENLDKAIEKLTEIFQIYLDSMRILGQLTDDEELLSKCIFQSYINMEICSGIPQLVTLGKSVPEQLQLLQRTQYGKRLIREHYENSRLQGTTTERAAAMNKEKREIRAKAIIKTTKTKEEQPVKNAKKIVMCFLGAKEINEKVIIVVPDEPIQSGAPNKWSTFSTDPDSFGTKTPEVETYKKVIPVNAHVIPIKATVIKNEALERCLHTLVTQRYITPEHVKHIMQAFYDNLVAIHIGKQLNFNDLFLLQMFITKTEYAGPQASRIAMASIVEAAKQCCTLKLSKALWIKICECIEDTAHYPTASAIIGNTSIDIDTLDSVARRAVRAVELPTNDETNAELTARLEAVKTHLDIVDTESRPPLIYREKSQSAIPPFSQDQDDLVIGNKSKDDDDIYATLDQEVSRDTLILGIRQANQDFDASLVEETSKPGEIDEIKWYTTINKATKTLVHTVAVLEKDDATTLHDKAMLAVTMADKDGIPKSNEEQMRLATAIRRQQEAADFLTVATKAETEAQEALKKTDLDLEEEEEATIQVSNPEPNTSIAKRGKEEEDEAGTATKKLKLESDVDTDSQLPPTIGRTFSIVGTKEIIVYRLSKYICRAFKETDKPRATCEEIFKFFDGLYGEIFPTSFFKSGNTLKLPETKREQPKNMTYNQYLKYIGINERNSVIIMIQELILRRLSMLSGLTEIGSELTTCAGLLSLYDKLNRIQREEAIVEFIRFMKTDNTFLLLLCDVVNMKVTATDDDKLPKLSITDIQTLKRLKRLILTTQVPDLQKLQTLFQEQQVTRLAVNQAKYAFDIAESLKINIISKLENLMQTPQKQPPLVVGAELADMDVEGGAIMDYNMNANAKLPTKKKKLRSNKTKKSKTNKSKNKKPKHKKPKHKKPKHKTKNTKNYKSFFNKTLKKY